MLKKIIHNLREELAPLVRAELRASLEDSVRQELRREMQAVLTQETTKNASIEAGGAASSEQSSIQGSGAGRESSGQQLASLPPTQEQSVLLQNCAAAMSAKLDQTMNLRLDELRGTLRDELEPQIREELLTQVRAEMHEDLESEKQRLVEEATHHTLLEYLLKKNWQGIESFIEDLPIRMRLEAKAVLREALKSEVRETILKELRDEVKADEHHPIRKKIEGEFRADKEFRARLASRLHDAVMAQMSDDLEHPINKMVAEELRGDVNFRKTLTAKLKSELAPAIRMELEESLKPKVREELQNQLLMPLLLSADGNIEGTVAGVLRKNVAVCVDDMRDTILDEIWELAMTAIVESLGAAAFRNYSKREQLLESVMQAATEAYKPKSNDSRERLSRAVNATIDVISPVFSEDAQERWEHFAGLAQELVDDRLIPSSFNASRNLGIPDGFFRAVKPHACDATKSLINPGDFYVVARGLRIALPLTQETAAELVRRTEANEMPADADTIEPPWNGVPFRS